MKKLVLVSVMAFAVLLLVGCGKKAEVIVDDTTVQEVTTDKKEATKEQCMEIVKFGMDVAIAQSKGDTQTAQELAEKAMALEEKYNLEGVEFENACEKYMTDIDFIQMVQEGAQEMQIK